MLPRIAHIIASLDPAAGGPPRVVMELAAAQVAMGHAVVVASCELADKESAILQAMGSIPGFGAVHRQRVARVGLGDVWCGRVSAELHPVINTADHLHLHGVWEPILLATAREARRRGLPYALCAHGMLDPWSLAQKRWKKKLAMALGYRRMLDGAAFLHVLNVDEARLIQPLGLRCRIEVIPNGVFPQAFATLPATGTFRAEYPALGQKPFILFLSRLHYKKGLDILAEAFAQVAAEQREVMLVVAGPDDGAKPDFERRIAAASLTDRVLLVGPIYGDRKLAAMVDAACFCLPSRQEGFSLAITEAMACGCPVVISEECHFPQVATHGAGKVVPLSASAVAQAMQTVLSNIAGAQTMGHAGRELVMREFTWPAIAEKLTQAYAKPNIIRS